MPKPNEEQLEAFRKENGIEIEALLVKIHESCRRLLELGNKAGTDCMVVDCGDFTLAIQANEDANGGN